MLILKIVICSQQISKTKISISAVGFGCDYCPETFLSRRTRINHTATHFKSKTCLTCGKILICINDDWYELHTSVKCDRDNDITNDTVVNVKAEVIDYTLADGIELKSEANDYDLDDSRDENIFGPSPINFQNHIEVNSLPEIVKEIQPRTVFRKPKTTIKIQTKSKTQTMKKTVIEAKQVQKKRKQVVNKATFLDHRPTASCICDICNKTLGTFSSLRNHMINMHCVGERSERVSCEECGQTFSTPGNLNSHKKIHLKCKAYVCTYCGRGFNQLHNLKEHTNRL